MKQLPNVFTLLNLFFGCIAIVYILQNGIIVATDENGVQVVDIPEKIWYASLFISLAAVVDFLDGFIARLFKATSGMGKQLDSLADLVSFGVAPALILYQFLRLSYAQQENGLDVSMAWLSICFIIPCAAAYRLARFNLDYSSSENFKGLPVPANGLLIAAFPLLYWHSHMEWVFNLLLNKWFIYAVVIVLSWLMVSKLPMMSFKFKDYGFKNNMSRYALIVVAIVLVALLHWLAVPITFVVYVILSLLSKTKTA